MSTVEGYPKFKFFLPGTNDLAVGAKLYTYVVGTTTKKTSYQEASNTTANTNPIILDASGECILWLEGKYDLVLAPANDTDPPTSPYWTMDNMGPGALASGGTGTSAIPNGSFELDDDGGGVPDGWTLAPGASNTITIDATSSMHGTNSLRFAINSANVGIASTEIFEVGEGVTEGLSFALVANLAAADITVRMAWYTSAKVFVSNSDIYTNAATTPVAWTDVSVPFTPPATAKFAILSFHVAGTGNVINIDNVRLSSIVDITVDDYVVNGVWTFSNDAIFLNNLTRFGPSTPNSNWHGNGAIELGATGFLSLFSADLDIGANAYYDGANWRHATTGSGASRMRIAGDSGVSEFMTATGGGTAGDTITWQTKYTIPRTSTFRWLDGEFLISTDGTNFTPQHSLVVNSPISTGNYLQFTNPAVGTGTSNGFTIGYNALYVAQVWNAFSTPIEFGTNGTRRGKIGFAGNWLFGDTANEPAHQVVIYEDSSGTLLQLANPFTGLTATDGFQVGIDSNSNATFTNHEASAIHFSTDTTFRGKVDANGGWLVSPAGGIIAPTHEMVVYNSTGVLSGLQLIDSLTGTGEFDGLVLRCNGAGASADVINYGTGRLHFGTNAQTKAFIDGNGSFVISPGGDVFTPAHEMVVYETSGSPTLQLAAGATVPLTATEGFILTGTATAGLLRNYEGDIFIGVNSGYYGQLTSTGNWLFGDTASLPDPSHDLVIGRSGVTTTTLQIVNGTTGFAGASGFTLAMSSLGEARLHNYFNADMIFSTNNLQEMYLDASSRGVVVGVPTGAGQGVGSVNAESLHVNGVALPPPPAAVAGFTAAGYIVRHDSLGTSTDLSVILSGANGVWESYGPTADATADNTWSALDSIPLEATSVIIRIYSNIRLHGVIQEAAVFLRLAARPRGSAISVNNANILSLAQATGDVASISINYGVETSNVTEVIVPLDGTNSFELTRLTYTNESIGGGTLTQLLSISLSGYII